VTDRTLSDDERLRAWIYIHRQRKEWDAKEKEMVAYRLVDLVGRAGAANILGITVRELDKLVEIFELSERFKGLRDPSAAITWARELMGVTKKLLTPSVIDAVVEKVAQKRITNSKDLRKLRAILPDPVARENFLSEEGDLETASLRIAPAKGHKPSLGTELDAAVEAMRTVPWTALAELKGDPEILRKIDDAQALLKSLRKTLSSN
jgi:ParB family transcriptional regulator, chromosome partitioning protein